jgi:hypothetical protein
MKERVTPDGRYFVVRKAVDDIKIALGEREPVWW